jgi:MoaA/NifB/PqqE/SkfB family radical SAM enzyme
MQHSVSLEDARLALDILARNDVRYVHFTGGEPLIHRDIVEIIAHARGLAMSSQIVTNGWLLSAAKIDALAEAGLTALVISVDAPSTTVHDENRGLRAHPRRMDSR